MVDYNYQLVSMRLLHIDSINNIHCLQARSTSLKFNPKPKNVYVHNMIIKGRSIFVPSELQFDDYNVNIKAYMLYAYHASRYVSEGMSDKKIRMNRVNTEWQPITFYRIIVYDNLTPSMPCHFEDDSSTRSVINDTHVYMYICTHFNQ